LPSTTSSGTTDARAAARATVRVAPPATRSDKIAPASMEASCSGSPTSTSRASGRNASSSLANIVSDTIDASSTTTTSCGSRRPAWCQNCAEPRRTPSNRWSVCGSRVRRKASSSSVSTRSCGAKNASRTIDWPRREAARAVGAARAMRRGSGDDSCRATSSRATVVVFPVPGPPPSTATLDSAQVAAAARWSSGSPPDHSRANAAPSSDWSTVTGSEARRSRSSATKTSCRQ